MPFLGAYVISVRHIRHTLADRSDVVSRYFQSQGLFAVPTHVIAAIAPVNALLNWLLGDDSVVYVNDCDADVFALNVKFGGPVQFVLVSLEHPSRLLFLSISFR